MTNTQQIKKKKYQKINKKNNFSNILNSFNLLFAMISFDGYPECILPSITYSRYYLIYFISYVTLQLFIFVPIPVAVVFESYCRSRSKYVLQDRIKQRECLLASFISIDFNEQVKQIYKHKNKLKKTKKKQESLFLHLDKQQQQILTLDDFFDLIDVLESNKKFSLPYIKDNLCWKKTRNFFNKKLYLKKIANNNYFELFMSIVLIFNIIVIILSLLELRENIQKIYETIDDLIVYIYVIEFGIKFIGLGFEKYFEDSWNVFDFLMLIMTLSTNILTQLIQVLKNAKLLKISRINRIIKIFNKLRSFKVFNLLIIGAETLNQVQLLIQKIFMCIPIILQLIPILIIIFYLYAVWGMEIFNIRTFSYKKNSPYQENILGDFTSFKNSLLILFQIMIESNWSLCTYDYAYKFGNFLLSMFFFNTFEMFISLILLSLIKGVVWEVFRVVDQELKEKNQEKESQHLIQKKESQIISQPNNIQEINNYFIIINNIRNNTFQNSLISSEGALPYYPQECPNISKKLQEDEDKNSNLIDEYKQFFTKLKLNNNKNFNSPRDFDLRKEKNPLILLGEKRNSQSSSSQISIIQGIFEIKEQIYGPSIKKQIQKYIYKQYTQYSEIVNKIEYQQSQTNQKTKSESNISINSQINNIENEKKIQIEIIRHLKIKIKPFKFLKTIQKQKKKQNMEIDFSQDFLLSDNAEAMRIYIKQMHDDLLDDKEDEEQKKKNEELIKERNQYGNDQESINSNYMMKKALLKDSNMDMIKKLEIDYFQDCYGTFFNIFHDVNADNWFCIHQQDNKYQPFLIGDGPWDYYDKIFNKKNEIFISKDFFLTPQIEIMQQLMVKFYESFAKIASCIENDQSFLQLNPNDKIFSMPLAYVIEMLKNLQDILQIHRTNFYIKNSLKDPDMPNCIQESIDDTVDDIWPIIVEQFITQGIISAALGYFLYFNCVSMWSKSKGQDAYSECLINGPGSTIWKYCTINKWCEISIQRRYQLRQFQLNYKRRY
ncbi:hypothetical protein IMG5_001520 [Ichthyophthirius multifiliis]|uniref:Ion transport domain-containing protein n=1 Tax=Ichthyophthirius multifiliis TaxID=5932 RepID=G0QIZ1_ICHMU|nr:hypothetical protein IMG5_001520 [Ichthyophthirius multifiliis]EGR34811.1 hypothetical protein IMG5_001520 [Ichthyophthirius multifiliis]|eukprot:XP_004040115.1 hypothetical protein IMG5_001520 [Ichthyophthirius multifiliis]